MRCVTDIKAVVGLGTSAGKMAEWMDIYCYGVEKNQKTVAAIKSHAPTYLDCIDTVHDTQYSCMVSTY